MPRLHQRNKVAQQVARIMLLVARNKLRVARNMLRVTSNLLRATVVRNLLRWCKRGIRLSGVDHTVLPANTALYRGVRQKASRLNEQL